MNLRALLPILLLTGASAPAYAQESEWMRLGDPVITIISRDATGCSERPAESADAITETVMREDVSGTATYRFSGRDLRFEEGREYPIRLVQTVSKSDRPPPPVEGRASGFRNEKGWSGLSLTLTSAQRTALGAGGFGLYEGKHKHALAEFAASRPLHRCALELGRIDPGSGKPALTHAEPVRAYIAFNDDYPIEALRAGEQGVTVFQVTISAKGRVSACKIVESSGSALLDFTTCNLVSLRARFTPALDSDGQPTEEDRVDRWTWTIPE